MSGPYIHDQSLGWNVFIYNYALYVAIECFVITDIDFEVVICYMNIRTRYLISCTHTSRVIPSSGTRYGRIYTQFSIFEQFYTNVCGISKYFTDRASSVSTPIDVFVYYLNTFLQILYYLLRLLHSKDLQNEYVRNMCAVFVMYILNLVFKYNC